MHYNEGKRDASREFTQSAVSYTLGGIVIPCHCLHSRFLPCYWDILKLKMHERCITMKVKRDASREFTQSAVSYTIGGIVIQCHCLHSRFLHPWSSPLIKYVKFAKLQHKLRKIREIRKYAKPQHPLRKIYVFHVFCVCHGFCVFRWGWWPKLGFCHVYPCHDTAMDWIRYLYCHILSCARGFGSPNKPPGLQAATSLLKKNVADVWRIGCILHNPIGWRLQPTRFPSIREPTTHVLTQS